MIRSRARFAPSKYCAFVGIASPEIGSATGTIQRPTCGMTIELYTAVRGRTPIFDGHRAHQHLTGHLGMIEHSADTAPRLLADFQKWIGRWSDRISVHPRGLTFILPPEWYCLGAG
jgi:hypothetical protein